MLPSLLALSLLSVVFSFVFEIVLMSVIDLN